jgi:hypothetical protein
MVLGGANFRKEGRTLIFSQQLKKGRHNPLSGTDFRLEQATFGAVGSTRTCVSFLR